MASDTTLAGPLRDWLSHASLRVRLVGESGTAVRGEVGREEIEPLSDMEREAWQAQGDMDVASTGYQGVIDTRTASVDNPSSP